jgi:hypothetical protein
MYLQARKGNESPRLPYICVVHTLRSYRLVPALLALSLVLTAATPFVRYSCGMTVTAKMPCCDDEAGHHDAPSMPIHVDTGGSAMPCHDAPGEAPSTPPAPCPNANSPALHDACCSTASAPVAPTPERVELNPTALTALVVAFLRPAAPSADALTPPPADASLPAPVALHLLYGTFLT